MLKLVIDEDIPRSTGIILKENGYEVLDIRDHGLRGENDEKIYEFAQENEAVFLVVIKIEPLYILQFCWVCCAPLSVATSGLADELEPNRF